MKTRRFELRAVIGFLGVVLSCCLLSPHHASSQEVTGERPTTDVIVTGEKSDVQIVASIPKENLAELPVRLTLTAINQSTEPIHYTVAGRVDWILDVKYANTGQGVPLTRYGKAWVNRNSPNKSAGRRFAENLEPGYALSEIIILSRLFDLSVAGTYDLFVSRTFNEFSVDLGKDERVGVELRR